MVAAVPKNERFATAQVSRVDGVDRTTKEGPQPNAVALRPRDWPGGLRRNCLPRMRVQPSAFSLAPPRVPVLPDLPLHSRATVAPADAADDKEDRTVKR